MKNFHVATAASATSWSALALNEFFTTWNPVLQGTVYILAIITSIFALFGYLKHKKPTNQ
jgi:hypothetical protein